MTSFSLEWSAILNNVNSLGSRCLKNYLVVFMWLNIVSCSSLRSEKKFIIITDFLSIVWLYSVVIYLVWWYIRLIYDLLLDKFPMKHFVHIYIYIYIIPIDIIFWKDLVRELKIPNYLMARKLQVLVGSNFVSAMDIALAS